MLHGKKGLPLSGTSHHSIAYGCAREAAALSTDLALTYLNEKVNAGVAPSAEELDHALLLLCDAIDAEQFSSVFEAIDAEWGLHDFPCI